MFNGFSVRAYWVSCVLHDGGAAPLGDAVRPGGKLVALLTGILIRHDVTPRHVPSLSTRGRQRPQAARRCAQVCEEKEFDNCAGRVRVFAPLTKLLASPSDGSGMARRTGARQLARALVSANNIELDQPAGDT